MQSSLLLICLVAIAEAQIFASLRRFFEQRKEPFPLEQLPLELREKIVQDIADPDDLAHFGETSRVSNSLVNTRRYGKDVAMDSAYLSQQTYHRLFDREYRFRANSFDPLVIPSRNEGWLPERVVLSNGDFKIVQLRDHLNEDQIQMVVFKHRQGLEKQFGIWTTLRRHEIPNIIRVHEPVSYLAPMKWLDGSLT